MASKGGKSKPDIVMASKSGKSKPDNESRAKRQKTLEAPKEPRRPKTHWDHVLEEMAWLSKDFESERKWKLAQAKKVALRASKGMLDQASREERKLKEEEQRLRKVALNISKDMKKFWMKVLYKHQLVRNEKKKKAMDKQLEFLLGQTERYSTMLAENLVEPYKQGQNTPSKPLLTIESKSDEERAEQIPPEINSSAGLESGSPELDEDYDLKSEDETEDDEDTIEEDEKHFTKRERQEELEALQNEVDLPVEELLRRYTSGRVSRETSPVKDENEDNLTSVSRVTSPVKDENQDNLASVGQDHGEDKNNLAASEETEGNPSVRRSNDSYGHLAISETHSHDLEPGMTTASVKSRKEDHTYDFNDEQEDVDFVLANGEEKDDEATLAVEEELAKADNEDHVEEIALLQKESEMPIEVLLARYKEDFGGKDISEDESESSFAVSEDSIVDSDENRQQADLDDDNVDLTECKLDPEPCSENVEGTFHEVAEDNDKDSSDKIADAAAAARSAQPTGFTYSTTKVRTKLPFLLKHSLREYQHIGLDWLVTMYEKKLNGILADEMGLGKTIMTIALLAHLACDKGIWGPHLIVVPTSVMLNWETEFLKWCPAFKILTYFGSAKERKLKRQGWMKLNSFHVCITTYRLVIQDSKMFKRKKWKYLILDEAHLIKNWKSQRWQTLLNFNSKRRILLTGTPLQNDLMELWSLMHFLMPHVFQSHQEFKDWFCNPIAGMVEGQEKINKEVIDRLHNVLRPFLLRRLKRDVEKQLPSKHEHVIFCRLSKRQRNLYEDFIASTETQATLTSGSFFGMISIIMQLRKVCNHPDLFEGRPIVSSFDMAGIDVQLSSTICSLLLESPFSKVDLEALGFLFTHLDFSMTSWEGDEIKAISTPSELIKQRVNLKDDLEAIPLSPKNRKNLQGTNIFEEIRKAVFEERIQESKDRAAAIAWWNSLRCQRKPTYSTSLRTLLTIKGPLDDLKANCSSYMYSSILADIVLSPIERFQKMIELVEAFTFAIPAARVPSPTCWCSKSDSPVFLSPSYKEKVTDLLSPLLSPIRPAIVRRQVYFPDRRLIQFDCGKLQELAMLLRKLKFGGHRALIFTQMTKMLDVLEAFINLYGYTYMRLDGSTPPEERQTLMQRFNTNPKIFLFILSTRSGGVGINLVGADTVIFYDSDWNPAMDQQAQDRCHRIGQTREVHIYRLISESTIEENILKKANQKRVLDNLVIQNGEYNTEFFKKLDPMELFSGHKALTTKDEKETSKHCGADIPLSNADVEAALKQAEDEADYMALKRVEQEEAVDNQEFTEEPVERPEDDELVNEDDIKADEPADQGLVAAGPAKEEMSLLHSDIRDERAVITTSSQEDDTDVLDDVKQMAAAAADAGQAISSFENQLRPIDRYAIRFLELWDPIIVEAAMENEAGFEEKEWELDHIEKYKEEMEAEIDDGEEPLVYEKWDADFATEAYRQQVEVLAQHQLMEDLENEAREREAAEVAEMVLTQNESAHVLKPKKKKKAKKAKYKSLKKGSLAAESKHVKSVVKIEDSTDDDNEEFGYVSSSDSDMVTPLSRMHMKGKKRDLIVDTDEEKTSKKKAKKHKKSLPNSDIKYKQTSALLDELEPSKPSDSMVVDNELKLTNRGKTVGKKFITSMPIKRVLMIKPEKLKKGNLWSRDCVPSPDSWLPQEDAILCAMVHEYGPNWNFVSGTLYGMTAGGAYRGRYRHPAYCCERYRELIQRHILSASDSAVNEKNLNTGSGKALLKVTEENIRTLLNVAAEQPDTEMLLQKHFSCLLSSIWRTSTRTGNDQMLSLNSPIFNRQFMGSVNHTQDLARKPWQGMKVTSLSRKLLESALQDSGPSQPDNTISRSRLQETQPINKLGLELTLEFPRGNDDSLNQFPPMISLSIDGSDSLNYVNEPPGEDVLKGSRVAAENRYRNAANACIEDSFGWASNTFPANDLKSRTGTKAQSLGKHKLSASDSAKSTKSKHRKLLAEQLEGAWVRPNDPNLKFDFTPGDREEEEEQEVDEKANSAEIEMISCSQWYDPFFTSGLDDCSLASDISEIE
ncbi:SNF2 domain-containing protein / helicase domain-containing protein [Arabidopsis thaliana]|uniref:DNA helicase n=1 Tax=Arabidopsis thaliana TaxID=3702 RepID=A0A1I9LQH7_ARATH|nr:SNF2 domain-containing protein / helicase domain-containing protein [Arabidopsis thaliana]ANM64835.1 SNF2 domain-containing protein / helicase domain-containing protein [Arabidopsis thaliana]|eukprot:NP_001326839.1 SNF2 domain-containing protein / helicase domain-containing protein [Arabidopsis thaliana]